MDLPWISSGDNDHMPWRLSSGQTFRNVSASRLVLIDTPPWWRDGSREMIEKGMYKADELGIWPFLAYTFRSGEKDWSTSTAVNEGQVYNDIEQRSGKFKVITKHRRVGPNEKLFPMSTKAVGYDREPVRWSQKPRAIGRRSKVKGC